jgi:hypothetical protein
MNAPVVYLVKFWVKPGGEKKVFGWLDGGHLQDVVAQPGFLWARRYKLTEPDKDGWPGYAMIYGVKSMQALSAYFNSAATKRYADERKALGLDGLLKMDRAWGALEIAVEAPAAVA